MTSQVVNCWLCDSPFTRWLFDKEHYSFYRCLKCDFVFITPLPSTTTLNKYYAQFDYRSDLSEKIIRRDANRSLDLIDKYIGVKKNLLDIGCGRGYFIDEANKRGFIGSGIDVSHKVLRYAQKMHLDVKRADICTYRTNRRFDIIVINQVIEHTSSPVKLIRNCYSLLNSGGLLYIATPNINSWLFYIHQKDFHYIIPPEHLGYYGFSSLKYLLIMNNFKIISGNTWSYPEEFAGAIKFLLGKREHVVSIPSNHYKNTKQPLNIIKVIKLVLFDRIFCKGLFNLMNIGNHGATLQLIAQKQ